VFKEMKLMNRMAIRTALLGVLLIGFSALAQEDPLDAATILDRVNTAWQGDSFHGIVSLEMVLSGQTKSHKLEVWTLGEELALIRILEPQIDLNSGYLQLGDQLYRYVPGMGAIDLTAVALSGALFGAGPSLEDLSRGTLSDDYDASVEATEAGPEGAGGFFLTLIPHLDAPVVYGRLEIAVTTDYVMERLIYYDQRGDVLQTADFTDVVEVGDRKFATTVVIEDAYGDQTIQRIEGPQFGLQLDASFFSIETFETWEDGE
jgi:hypothetical protein